MRGLTLYRYAIHRKAPKKCSGLRCDWNNCCYQMSICSQSLQTQRSIFIVCPFQLASLFQLARGFSLNSVGLVKTSENHGPIAPRPIRLLNPRTAHDFENRHLWTAHGSTRGFAWKIYGTIIRAQWILDGVSLVSSCFPSPLGSIGYIPQSQYDTQIPSGQASHHGGLRPKYGRKCPSASPSWLWPVAKPACETMEVGDETWWNHSLDWFKGKSTGKPWVFTIKYRTFRLKCSHHPILWTTHDWDPGTIPWGYQGDGIRWISHSPLGYTKPIVLSPILKFKARYELQMCRWIGELLKKTILWLFQFFCGFSHMFVCNIRIMFVDYSWLTLW